MSRSAHRIDVHQHIVPAFYREELAEAGIADAGDGRCPPGAPSPPSG